MDRRSNVSANTILGILKLAPGREKMEPALEELRSIAIRVAAIKRDYGPENHEYKRLDSVYWMLWSRISKAQRDTFIAYMSADQSAPVPDVPAEGEAERSI